MPLSTTSPDLADTILRAMQFPLDEVILRYSRDMNLPLETAREHERELRRFLILCAINPCAEYGMTGPIDNLWHTFLLFTRLYAKFCGEVAGKFLHHEPTSNNQKLSRTAYQLFLTDYEIAFEESPPAHFWPRQAESETDCRGGCGCAKCGERACNNPDPDHPEGPP